MHEQTLAKIAGKDAHAISGGGYVQQAHKERNELKEILKKEAWNLKKVPKFVKIELVRIIDGERRNIDPRFIEGIEKYREDIKENWPLELRNFIFTVLTDLKTGDFSYEEFWTEQQAQKDQDITDSKLKLFEQFNKAAKRTKLDSQIRYDVYKMIDGDKEGFRSDTIKWMKELFKGSIPSVWGDDIARFLQTKLREID